VKNSTIRGSSPSTIEADTAIDPVLNTPAGNFFRGDACKLFQTGNHGSLNVSLFETVISGGYLTIYFLSPLKKSLAPFNDRNFPSGPKHVWPNRYVHPASHGFES
jgi:hypothetical protein